MACDWPTSLDRHAPGDASKPELSRVAVSPFLLSGDSYDGNDSRLLDIGNPALPVEPVDATLFLSSCRSMFSSAPSAFFGVFGKKVKKTNLRGKNIFFVSKKNQKKRGQEKKN